MNQPHRLESGGAWIDRSRPLRFTFNGAQLQGYAGDTVASALLACGVRIVSRSYKYHRPRGVFSAGEEEPNAIVTVGEGATLTPNVRATLAPLTEGMVVRSQSGWPSVNFDVGGALSAATRVLPAGFYYKTFMWPPRWWMFYEKIIRKLASAAPSPATADEDRYAHRHAHADVLVIGGGPAGLAAALAAGDSGARVILAEMRPALGGDLLGNPAKICGETAEAWTRATTHRLSKMDNVTVLARTTVQGYYDYNFLTAVQELSPGAGAMRRLWKIRAQQTVVAAGAIERPLVFAGNDCPKVMLAGAVGAYIHRYGVLPGRNILFFTNNDSAYQSAFAAADAGARVEIADIRGEGDDYWRARAKDRKIAMYLSCGIAGLSFTGQGLAAKLARLSPGAEMLKESNVFSSRAYDVVAVSGGWTPSVHLFSQSRGELAWNTRCGAFVPKQPHPINPCRACGAANGFTALSECLRDGNEAGIAAARAAGFDAANSSPPKTDAQPTGTPPLFAPIIPATHPVGKGPGKHFVDFMNDATAADIELSAREGYESAEHMKRYTAAGFGTDQGKTGNINALQILARARGLAVEDIGHTTYRPHYTPVAMGTIAGAERRELFAPARTTPMHSWHLSRNAVFEDVGEWKRPYAFPRGGETTAEAVQRECKAARETAALMDASTLGKIDLQGADAAQFLDMIYTNQMSTLKNGKCRYGLMLREDGMVYDDGVCARLGDCHYHLTTSTGHAAGVMSWLEEWLQTEWPQLRVYCASVTEQWAVISIAGPKSREILAQATDISLAAADFPFMSVKPATVAGVAARIFRVSFSGELGFEVNVPARYGLFVWQTLAALGESLGITPYGMEAMRVLRAEKGFIIAGQDSDGATSPLDMGLKWMLSKKKTDFIGKRSLSRPDIVRKGRPQFVGLLSEDKNERLPEGAYLVAAAAAQPPMKNEGYVTSSYMSPTLNRAIALGMVNDGFSRKGETLYAALPDGRRIKTVVADAVFYDKEGARNNG